MVKNPKTWISQEQNITFLWKKILNLCLRWHILRIYHFSRNWESPQTRYLLKHGMTWNNLKRSTTSKKRLEMTYNKQETTWNDLQRARKDLKNDLKQPTASKKWPETTYNKQETTETTYNKEETTWNDLQRAGNDLKQPTASKKWPETTYNEQETTWNDPQRVRYNLKWPKLTYNEKKSFGNIVHHDMNFLI